MKKKILLVITLLSIFLLTGCVENNKLEGANITTTVYPIEYLTTRLYKDYKEIKSIYPNDVDIEKYKLTSKKINDFSKNTNLFIYNGLSSEKEIAKTLINKNKKMQIIDVSYGLKYQYGMEELWLNPNYYLMLATTIKKNLQELTSSKYAAEEIEKNYKVLEEELTTLDAKLRSIAEAAKNNHKETIIVAYDTFGFLEKYGFNVINISKDINVTNNIKNKFKRNTYKKIFVNNREKVSDSIKELVDDYGAELIEVSTMSTLTDEQKQNKENYLTIMNDFLNKLSNVVLA